MNLEEHLSKEQYRQLLRVAATEGCNYFTFNIPNTVVTNAIISTNVICMNVPNVTARMWII